MKTFFKIFTLIVVAGLLIYAFVGVDTKTNDLVCTGIELNMKDSLNQGLIDEPQVMQIIQKNNIALEGKKISDINMTEIEQLLSKSPYIDTVMCTLMPSGKISLTVLPLVPLMHVMSSNGENYYIDRHGNVMPVGNIVGNLCIASGNISHSYAKDELSKLAVFLQEHEYWASQVQQIHVIDPNNVRLYTRVADHYIQLGNLEELEQKFQTLETFYEKGLPVTGWNKYESIDVSYKDIVIGKQKNYKPKPQTYNVAQPPIQAPEVVTPANDSANKATQSVANPAPKQTGQTTTQANKTSNQ